VTDPGHKTTPKEETSSSLSFAVLALASWTGFVSLSYELLWMRIFSFMAMGRSFAFPMCLGLFLLGIAIGARLSKRFSRSHAAGSRLQLRVLAKFMLASSIFGWLTIPLMQLSVNLASSISMIAALYLICGGAVLFGVQFPLLAHFGITADASSGAKVSYIYVANIVGSVAGSLLTGFLLMDLFSLAELTTGLGIFGSLVGATILAASHELATARIASVAVGIVCSGCMLAGKAPLFDDLYLDLLRDVSDTEEIKVVLESKSGVVAVNQNDQVFGGGVYDGQFQVSFVDDTNMLIRPFSLSAFHPKPEEILLIGLGSGSWAKVVAEHPDAKSITIVEISPDYVRLTEHYPGLKKIIDDPRVTLVTDDGRRWLTGTDQRFDAIVSNTTFHWRSMASNLLSSEFFELVKRHLKPGGVFMFNTTESIDAMRTSQEIFSDVYLTINAIIASPDKIPYDVDRLERTLRTYKIDGKPIVPPDDAKAEAYLRQVLTIFRSANEEVKFNADGHVVIDADFRLANRADGVVIGNSNLRKYVSMHGGQIITDHNMKAEWDLMKMVNFLIDDM
jgi:spermidine synthase